MYIKTNLLYILQIPLDEEEWIETKKINSKNQNTGNLKYKWWKSRVQKLKTTIKMICNQILRQGKVPLS